MRGLVAGLLAGVVAFGVSYVIGEPSVNAAIALERASDDALVPRSMQSTLGLLTGMTVAGVTLGGLLGVVCALAMGRLGRLGIRPTALAVAAVAYVAFQVLPTTAYPPNPPGVGRADTIDERTTLFFVMVAVSVIAAVTAVLAGRRLAVGWGGWYATLAATAGYLLLTLTAVALLPHVDEVPPDYPATVLYEFRRASFVTQLTLWSVLAVVLADLLHRLVDRAAHPVRSGTAAPR